MGGVGIIPALAGNTTNVDLAMWEKQDHPRSRGEYSRVGVVDNLMDGSSPLSRGIPGRRFDCSPRQRIIPALAGNTNYCARID